MSLLRRRLSASLLAASLGTTLVACGSSEPNGDDAGDAGDAGDLGPDNLPEGEEACELLDDATVDSALGPNDGGAHDYQYGGCIWSGEGTDSQGLPYTLSVAVTTPETKELVADTRVEPIEGFGEGATWSTTWAELWFPCLDGNWCLVHASVAEEDDERRAVAVTVAEELQSAVS